MKSNRGMTPTITIAPWVFALMFSNTSVRHSSVTCRRAEVVVREAEGLAKAVCACVGVWGRACVCGGGPRRTMIISPVTHCASGVLAPTLLLMALREKEPVVV